MTASKSCKILPHSVINPCAVFWHVISPQSHGRTPQTKPPGSYFIFSPVPAATRPRAAFLTERYFWSEHGLTCQTWEVRYTRAKVIYKLHKLQIWMSRPHPGSHPSSLTLYTLLINVRWWIGYSISHRLNTVTWPLTAIRGVTVRLRRF